jgi:hypothetical protein
LLAEHAVTQRALDGTANVLSQVRLGDYSLTIELSQIDGGREGVVLTLSVLVETLASQRGIGAIQWIAHAVSWTNDVPSYIKDRLIGGFSPPVMGDEP